MIKIRKTETVAKLRHVLCVSLLASCIGAAVAPDTRAASLTVDAGVVVKFGPAAGLVARDKTLIADDVTATSQHDDGIGDPLSRPSVAPAVADWQGIRFERTAFQQGATLGNNLQIRYAGAADTPALQLRGFDGTLNALRIESSATGLKLLDSPQAIVTGSGFVGNTIGIDVGDGAGLTASGSSFSGQRQFGIANLSGNALAQATGNWWGSASGPTNAAGNPTGQGDPVSANINFGQWQAKAPLLAPVLGLANPLSVVDTHSVDVRLGCLNATEYRLSELPSFAGASFAPLTAIATFRFSDGDGTKPLYVQYRDASGQLLSKRLAQDVTVDTQAPTVSITTPAPASVIVESIDVEAQAADASGVANVEFYLGQVRLGSTSTAPYTQHLDTSVVPDGDYVLSAIATDKAGRTAHVDLPITVARVAPPVDTVGPVISQIKLDNVALTPDTAASVDGALSVVAADRSGISRVEFLLDGTQIGSDGTADAGSVYRATLHLDGVANGTHALTVRGVDSLNNVSETNFTFQVQHVPPPAPVIAQPQNAAVVGLAALTVSGSTVAGNRVHLVVNDEPQTTDVTSDSRGSFQTTATLRVGDNTIAAIAADQYGDSAPSAAIHVTLDQTLPSPPGGLQATAMTAGRVHLTWSLSGDPKTTGYELYRAPIEFTAIGEAQKVAHLSATTTVYDDVPATDGRYFYRVVAVNALGTASAPTNAVNVLSDKTLPFAERIDYQAQGAFDAGTGVYGLGRVAVKVTMSEALLGAPYLSLVPQGGLPIPVDLIKRDDTHYEGTLTLGSSAGTGIANVLFSARDVLGNRGAEVREGATLAIDTVGPALTGIAVDPSAPIKVDASRDVSVTFTFDEATAAAPAVQYQLSGASRTAVTLSGLEQVDHTTWRAHIQLPADAGGSGAEELSFAFVAKDALGNQSSQIKAANAFQVYQGELPALNSPLGLTAAAMPGGAVQLEWQAVEGASAYQLLRQAPSDAQLMPLTRVTTASDVDATSADGLYRYAVAAIRSSNGQESQSPVSATVDVRSSRTAPGAPENLALSLTAQGVLATWQPPVGSTPASYRLYRAAASTISSVAGLTPIKQNLHVPQAVDAAPSQSEHAYVVTAVDAAGNESAISNSVYLNFSLLPVKALQVEQVGSDLPVLSWTPNGQGAVGYDVYVGLGDARTKLTPSPITATTLTDTGFTGGERRYTVETIDANDVRMARSVVLPNASAQVVSGLPLKRNVMNRLGIQVSNLSADPMTATQVVVTIGARKFASEVFSLSGNATRVVPVVIGGYPDLSNPVAVSVAVENTPNEGELVRVGKSQDVDVVDSALVVGLDAEGFTRGATGKVRLTFENTSDVEVELLTARNFGRDASNELRLKLLDSDGNLLSTVPYKQATGAGVITLSSGQTVARIAPGQRYVSDVFVMPVPNTSADQVRLRLEVDRLHYSTGQPEEVTIPGTGSEHVLSLTQTPYYGEITTVDPVMSAGNDDITVQGRAVDRDSGAAVPNAPLKLAINQEGFERLVDVTSDESGLFRYVFKPTLTDAGVYHVGAIHPDMTDRPDQAQFTINRVNVGPGTFKLSVPRNYPYKIDFRATSATGSQATNLRVVYAPEYQQSGTLLPGIQVEVPAPINIAPKQNLSLPVKVSGDNSAAPSGRLILAVLSDQSGSTPVGLLTVDYILTEAKPALDVTPTYVETGLSQGQSVIETVALENKGFVAMSDVTVTLLDKNGNPAPAWVSLAADPNLGSIAIGEKRTIDLNVSPTAQVPEGIYELKLRVAGSNLPAEDIGVFVSVTQSGQGNVLFEVADIYTKTRDKNNNLIPGVAGARLFLQNESVISQTYEATSTSDGEVFLQNLPAGTYKYKFSASNHQDATGRFTIKPGLTVNQTVFLEYTLISVEWSVREVTIEDRYEITLNATFETDVPAPVVVLQPTSINLPKLAAGEVFQGELTLTNYGLLRADKVGLELPTADDYFKFEFLAQPPTTLEAKQRVRLPYRVIALRTFGQPTSTAAALVPSSAGQVAGAGGSTTTDSGKTSSPGISSVGSGGQAGTASVGTGTATAANVSGTAGCFTYSNRAHSVCEFTCANGVTSTTCGSSANFFYVENIGCPVGTNPISSAVGSGGAGGDGSGSGGNGGAPTYSDVPGLPLCTKGSGECFQPKNKQSDTGKEGGQ